MDNDDAISHLWRYIGEKFNEHKPDEILRSYLNLSQKKPPTNATDYIVKRLEELCAEIHPDLVLLIDIDQIQIKDEQTRHQISYKLGTHVIPPIIFICRFKIIITFSDINNLKKFDIIERVYAKRSTLPKDWVIYKYLEHNPKLPKMLLQDTLYYIEGKTLHILITNSEFNPASFMVSLYQLFGEHEFEKFNQLNFIQLTSNFNIWIKPHGRLESGAEIKDIPFQPLYKYRIRGKNAKHAILLNIMVFYKMTGVNFAYDY